MDEYSVQTRINLNIPRGYIFSKHIDPTKIRHTERIGVFLWLVLGLIALWLSMVIRPEFDGYIYQIIFHPNLQQDMIISLKAVVIAFLSGGVIHEGVHGLLYGFFTRKMPLFGIRKYNLYTALPLHTYLTRTRFIIAALGPLCLAILNLLVLCPLISMQYLPWTILAGVTLAASTIADIFTFRMLLSERPDILVGFDGIAGAIYTPTNVFLARAVP